MLIIFIKFVKIHGYTVMDSLNYFIYPLAIVRCLSNANVISITVSGQEIYCLTHALANIKYPVLI